MTDLTAPTEQAPATSPAAGRALDRTRAALRVPRFWALAAILALAAGADFYQLQREGFANLYYAAAIRSMLQSWHNFFFNAFDPGGFVSVDKPPLGFWVQVASAKLLGYSGFSILLPEALAGVASVGVLYALVRRSFGTMAGLLAALFLAITPISIVTNRNNTIDSLLVLTVLLAAWAVSRAAEAGRLRWLLLGAALVGLGFNIKMLEAYLVVPALGALYLFGAPLGWWKRLWHLLVAGVVLVALSLSWLLAVDLTPANLRPYVGSSGSNSELALALGYNGIQRLLGQIFRIQANVASGAANANGPQGPGGVSENGAVGVFRLLNAQLGGQTSWLLALGILGMLATGWGLWTRALPRGIGGWRAAHLAPTAAALALWGLWTLTMGVFFSVAGFYHRYYLAMLAPGIAALAGIGVVLLWRDYRATQSSGWHGWLLPIALVATALTQGVILADYTDWSRWMTPQVVVATLAAAGALVWLRFAAIRQQNAQLDAPIPSALLALPADGTPGTLVVEALPPAAPTRPGAPSQRARAWCSWTIAPLLAVSLGVAALLVGPATWAGVSLANGGGGTLPAAGPSASAGSDGGPGVDAPGGAAFGRVGGFRGGFGGPPPGGFGGGFAPGGAAGNLPSGGAGGFPGANGGATGRGGAAPGGGGAGVDGALVTYLEARQGAAKYLFATVSSMTAAPYIIQTGKAVIALGGFSGSDQILTLSQLQGLIRSGQLKYFLLAGGGVGGPGGSGNSALIAWIAAHGTVVLASDYGGASAGGTLYYVAPDAAGA